MGYCLTPFERIEIAYNGKVFNCCPGWLDKPIGNIFKEEDFGKIWNSPKARAIRSSMIRNTYEFCIPDRCPYLIKGRFKPVKRRKIFSGLKYRKKTVLTRGPRIMALNYDPTCNLHCKSCRNHVMKLDKKKTEYLLKFQEKLLKTPLFRDVRELIVTGSGDAFASRVFLSLLRNMDEGSFPDLKITLRTNGILLTPKNWEKISNSHYAINWIKISIDAATKETYMKVRRGGDFDKLLNNLSFISTLKRGKKLKLTALFLMQKDNYKEIPRFVELMRTYKFNRIYFQKIFNRGTYTGKEFKEVSIHEAEHPEHKDFLEVLKNPVLRDPGVIFDIPLEPLA